MLDELERLRENDALVRLLELYALAGDSDRTAWQDRVMQLPGVDSRELVKLHGEILAHGWVEQNTGMTPVLKVGVAAGCYRITGPGLRAAKWARRDRAAVDAEAA